jgi:hypothetical protein
LAPLNGPSRRTKVVTVRASHAVKEALGDKPSAKARLVLEAWAREPVKK